jgi:adenylate cyclase
MREAGQGESEYWREFLQGATLSHAEQAFMRKLPHAPRCKICQAPFEGWGGGVLRLFGFRQIPGSPRICSYCLGTVSTHPGGAEIPVSILFADIRGSTAVAERIGATAFGALLNRFYGVATNGIEQAQGVVDKYLGDGVIGLFFRGISGDDHAHHGIDAGRSILAASRRGIEPIPVGAGVHTGVAFVGVVGTVGGPLDFTAVGDVVNTASRIGGQAAEGELLVSAKAADAAHLDTVRLELRSLEVRGRSEPVETWVLRDEP